MQNHNLYTLLSQNMVGSKPFILSPELKTLFSYRELDQFSAKAANLLQDCGLTKGDRVLIQVEKSPQALFIYFACLRLGLIYLPLNKAYTERELKYFLEDASPSLIVCDPAEVETFKVLSNAPVLTLDANGNGSAFNCENYPPEFENILCKAEDIASIIYTSGTTGKPKGAMISHGNLTFNALALDEVWQWQNDDVMLHALPIFHIHGLFIATHLPILRSSPIIFLPKFDAKQVLRLLPSATAFMGVPTHYVRLLNHAEFNRQLCEHIRVFTSASAPMLAQTHAQMTRQTGRAIVERYGMTEAGIIATNSLQGEVYVGTVGKAMPGVSIRVVDENGNSCATNQIGHIQVKGKNVFQGYWRLPEKNATEFTPDGYFITGDLGTFDSNENLVITGRGKDLIISGGLNVYPKEIELILDQYHGVLESAIIGLPHADFGEAVTAVIVKDINFELNETAMISYLKEKLANFKVPKSVYYLESLPRNTMGKVQKNVLRERFATS